MLTDNAEKVSTGWLVERWAFSAAASVVDTRLVPNPTGGIHMRQVAGRGCLAWNLVNQTDAEGKELSNTLKLMDQTDGNSNGLHRHLPSFRLTGNG